MSDVIHLLPDTVANQIAAGEVIQRPASVVKELVENSIDAGATSIKLLLKDAGRTYIQVIDNGKGMSETDARLCFDRHATSKISSADDLFALRTMGFRGEALPSISSISQLEMKTKRPEDEVGTLVEINGGKIERQESVACSDGTNFLVKNIFYNVPARRKFLKSNTAEFSHIEKEFFRVALVNPQVEFELYHNDQLVYQLHAGGLRERIIAIFGKNINAQLLSIEVDTPLVKIGGYVGKPETAKKQNDRQYFFVNGRYMRHPYFHKAVLQAFDRLIVPGTSPDYFIYFEVDPANIDVNIHPTKTEIKFESEQTIWPILMSCVKEALGKFNIVPSLDFEHGEDIFQDVPLNPSNPVSTSAFEANLDTSYNPFKTDGCGGSNYQYKKKSDPNLQNWETLYNGFESERTPSFSPSAFPDKPFDPSNFIDHSDTSSVSEFGMEGEENKTHYIQFKNKYILTVLKSGLACIDQHRAHVKVLYERYMKNFQQRKAASQQLMFPIRLEVMESEAMLLDDMAEDFSFLGFDISCLGKGSISINGIPSECNETEAENYLRDLLQSFKEGGDMKEGRAEKMAMKLAETSAIKAGKHLTEEEMMNLVSQLFSLPTPDYTSDNRIVMSIMSLEEIEKKFK